MTILSMDTSSTTACIAISKNRGVTVSEVDLPTGRHSSPLLPALDELLKSESVKIEEIDLFACGRGPGSFTGLRIGLSMMKGLAWSLAKPLVTFSSLEALAKGFTRRDHLLVPLLESRRNHVFGGIYSFTQNGLLCLEKDHEWHVEDLVKKFTSPVYCFGSGYLRYRTEINDIPNVIPVDPKDIVHFHQGRALIDLALHQKYSSIFEPGALLVEPEYRTRVEN